MIDFSTGRILLAAALLGAVSATLPFDAANAKRLSQCRYHDETGHIATPAEVRPGSDGKSITFWPGRRRGRVQPPPGTVDNRKLRCVVHLDCDIPANVANVSVKYEGRKDNIYRNDFLVPGMAKKKPFITLVESWVKPGFPVLFLNAAGAVIKTCKISLITDN